MVVLFCLLITLQFGIIISHDLIDIPASSTALRSRQLAAVAGSDSPRWPTPSPLPAWRTGQAKNEHLSIYAGTRQILPRRGDNPRPNLFHIGIHALFVVNFCLALALRLRRA